MASRITLALVVAAAIVTACGGGASPRDLPGLNQTLYVVVDDSAGLDAHYARARAAGAGTPRWPWERDEAP